MCFKNRFECIAHFSFHGVQATTNHPHKSLSSFAHKNRMSKSTLRFAVQPKSGQYIQLAKRSRKKKLFKARGHGATTRITVKSAYSYRAVALKRAARLEKHASNALSCMPLWVHREKPPRRSVRIKYKCDKGGSSKLTSGFVALRRKNFGT